MSESAGPLTLELVVAGFDSKISLDQPDTEFEVEEDVEVEEELEETDQETGEQTSRIVKKTVKQTRKETKPTPAIVSTVHTEPLLVTISDNVVLSTVKHTKPQRFGVKPEIKHIFRSPPQTLNAYLAAIITGGVVASISILLGAWYWFVGADLAGLGPALKENALSNIGFIVTIGALELTFFKYYRGVSIFETMGSIAIVAPSSLYFGSKTLRDVQARRIAGKF